MGKTFDYVVNFWFGSRGSRKKYKFDSSSSKTKETKTNYGAWYEAIHHYYLVNQHCKFLKKHKIDNLKNIIFVINHEQDTATLLKEVNEVIEWYELQDKIKVITHDNTNHSYGAWNASLKHLIHESQLSTGSPFFSHKTLSDYVFLCEDDYIPTDEKFYEPFFKVLEDDKVGYVAQHVDNVDVLIDTRNNKTEKTSYRHASVSNGFIRLDSCKSVLKKHKNIFNFSKILRNGYWNNPRALEQIAFTDNLIELGYKLEGISDFCYIPFDQNNSNNIKHFGDEKNYCPIRPYKYPDEIKLKILTKADIEWFLKIRNHDSTRKFLQNDNVFTLAEGHEWFDDLHKIDDEYTLYPYLIIYRIQRQYFSQEDIDGNTRFRPGANYIEIEHAVGYIRQYEIEIKGKKWTEIGADIDPRYRGKGYAKAAYINRLKKLNLASLWVFEDNFARNLYFDLGFRDNGKTNINRGRKEYQMTWKKKT
tara:strand:+ start:784 stop:2208 length:1425 start_codon:yes stop_codon:yes gene_type:complete